MMGFLNMIDKVLSYLESAKSDQKDAVTRQAPKAKKVQQATQQIITDDIKRRREEIRLAREQMKNNYGANKTF